MVLTSISVSNVITPTCCPGANLAVMPDILAFSKCNIVLQRLQQELYETAPQEAATSLHLPYYYYCLFIYCYFTI